MPAEQVQDASDAGHTSCRSTRNSALSPSIPGDTELDPKKLAHAAEVKKIELSLPQRRRTLTGYVRGGVTVMAARTFPFSPTRRLSCMTRSRSLPGQRGTQIVLAAPADYLRATGATLADLTKPPHRRRHRGGAMTYFVHVWCHLRKDLQLEGRSRDSNQRDAVLFAAGGSGVLAGIRSGRL